MTNHLKVTCKHFDTCGGCSFVAAYDDQLTRKRARLAQFAGMEVPPLIRSPRESGFRQKAAFVFGAPARGRRLLMGHYAAGSNRVVPIVECPVHSPRANRIAFALRDGLARAGVAAAGVPGGVLRHLIVRTTEDDAEAVAMLVVTRNDKALRGPVRGLLASPDAPDGFFVNVNTRPGPYMVGDETLKIAGRSHVRERGFTGADGGPATDFLVSPDAFFQTNVGAARELVKLVVEGVGSSERVLDLYCGSGLFALPLARAGATVTAVEENRTAVADVKANLKLNRVPDGQVTPIAGRVEDVIDRLAGKPWDAVVLDPPRDGCAPEALSALVERIRPARIVYVSCNPAALSRELAVLRQAGYNVDRVQGVDMFPYTEHIEAVATLSLTAPSRTQKASHPRTHGTH